MPAEFLARQAAFPYPAAGHSQGNRVIVAPPREGGC